MSLEQDGVLDRQREGVWGEGQSLDLNLGECSHDPHTPRGRSHCLRTQDVPPTQPSHQPRYFPFLCAFLKMFYNFYFICVQNYPNGANQINPPAMASFSKSPKCTASGLTKRWTRISFGLFCPFSSSNSFSAFQHCQSSHTNPNFWLLKTPQDETALGWCPRTATGGLGPSPGSRRDGPAPLTLIISDLLSSLIYSILLAPTGIRAA